VAEKSGHGTKMSAGADYHPSLDVTIHDPAIVGALQRTERDAFPDAGSTAAQKIFVELTALDTVADGPIVADINCRLFDAAQAKACNRLQNASGRVFLESNFQSVQHQQCD